jgi:hypothetical protein
MRKVTKRVSGFLEAGLDLWNYIIDAQARDGVEAVWVADRFTVIV